VNEKPETKDEKEKKKTVVETSEILSEGRGSNKINRDSFAPP
jgi:hypothetical protein